jgi:hypothetical protein
MTYKQLLQQLQQLKEEQLNQDVCICDSKFDCGDDTDAEYYQDGVEFVFATEECDVLDVDHPIIRF